MGVTTLAPIRLVCTDRPRVYATEGAPHTHESLNLVPEVELRVLEAIPGGDDAPIIVPAGSCKARAFEIPNEPWLWDINTEVRDDGSEWVVERHLAPKCPHCGRVADHLTVAVDPYPFTQQGLGRRERAVLNNPELLEILADLSEERRERALELVLKGIRGGADAGYAHVTEGPVALSAAVTKTILGAKAGSAVGLSQTHVEISFDGVTASAVPVRIDFGYCTFATNSPGTNSTNTAERQEYGRVIAADWTGARNWTTEPSVITTYEEMLLTPNGGLVIYDFPLGKEPDSALSEGHVITCTAPATVNVRATQKVRHV